MLNFLKSATKLTESEKAVRDTIIANPEIVLNASISELAKESNVGIATINRFASKVGYKGYKDFKVAYIKQYRELEQKNFMQYQIPFSHESTIETVKEQLTLHYRNAIDFTSQAIDETVLMRAVEYIKSRQVMLFATGAAKTLADCFVYKLEEAGVFAKSFDSFHYQYADTLKYQNKEMFAIVITHSGRNSGMLHILKTLKRKHIPTLLICTLKVSDDLVVNATDVLYTIPTKNTKELSNINFIVSIQYLLDLLYCLVLKENMDMIIDIARIFNYDKENNSEL